MALKVEVNLPNFPQGVSIGIVGVGVIENGGSIEISEAEESAFFMTNGYTLQDANQEGVSVTGSPEFTPPKSVEEETQAEQPTAVTSGLPTGLPQPEQEGGE